MVGQDLDLDPREQQEQGEVFVPGRLLGEHSGCGQGKGYTLIASEVSDTP